MAIPRKSFDELIELFIALDEKEEIKAFLKDMFTPQEVEGLAERWQVVQYLLKGELPQREIAKEVGCSVALVSRASRQVQYGAGIFKKLNKKIIEKEEVSK